MDQQKLGIGQLITKDQNRDAIHIAIAPVVVADTKLWGGSDVGLLPNGEASANAKPLIGVLDPFLNAPIRAGDKCWLFLYPGTITSLRHEWEHPSFAQEVTPIKGDKTVSEQWLRQYAGRVMDDDYGDPFENLISDLKQRSLTYRGRDCHGYSDLLDPELLFHHASIYLGEPVTQGQFEYFSCTC